MKKIYLMRHAKSSWKHTGLADFERPLNHRGKQDAPFMGRLLFSLKVRPAVIISSTAKRARSTAKRVARALEYSCEDIVYDGRIYDDGYSAVLAIISELEETQNSALIIGHNPDFTFLAEQLSGQSFGNIPTSGFVALRFDIDSWRQIASEKGTVEFYEYPKKHA